MRITLYLLLHACSQVSQSDFEIDKAILTRPIMSHCSCYGLIRADTSEVSHCLSEFSHLIDLLKYPLRLVR
jgi:hypothetical protein